MTSRPKTPPGSAPYRGVERAARAREVDRNAWAGNNLVVTSWDTIGSGTTVTPSLTFGAVFEDRPFFSYGVELQENETLATGDYPFTSCGVQEWQTVISETDDRGIPFYSGAIVWIRVSSTQSYRLRFRFAFEGIVIRNREYVGG